MKVSGIYKIQSKIKPDRIYIGSAKDINRREGIHLSKLGLGKHHSIKLQNHYNKYGKDDLVFSIITECKIDDLIKTEQLYIDLHDPYFNICKIAGSSLGIKRTPETNLKHSIATKGRKYGPQSEEMKLKNKNKKRVLVVSEETKIKIRNSLRGVKHTEERRKNISKGQIGRVPSRGNTGMKHSEEHKRKISSGMKHKWMLRKLISKDND